MIHTIDVNVKLIVQPHDLMSSKSLVTIHFVLKDNAQALQAQALQSFFLCNFPRRGVTPNIIAYSYSL